MRCTNKLLFAIVTAAISSAAYPCSVGYCHRENISFFHVTEGTTPRESDIKKENLLLWQQETSRAIPLADIEEIVYGSFTAEAWGEDEVPDSIKSNKFYRWIRSTKAVDVQEFLSIAKRVERLRAERCSPWYYPAHKTERKDVEDSFVTLIEQCSEHMGGKLRERYGLQMIRLLHASCQYEECAATFARWFGDVPNNHLMKRMAMDYVAGAWTRLGDVDKANKYFAMTGDIESLNGVNALAYMAEVNPSAYPMKELEYRLRRCEPGYGCGRYSDKEVKNYILPIVRKIVIEGKARNIGEWEFLLAYLEGEFNDNYKAANRYIHKALAHGLTTQTGRDHARAYKMAVDGMRGNVKPLLADLKWLEGRVKNSGDVSLHWRDVMLGVVYCYWFSYLTEHNRLPMAVLLSNYVENFCGYYMDYEDSETLQWKHRFLSSQEKKQMRASRKDRNKIDFSGRFVDFVMTLKPQELIDYKHCLKDSSRLVTYLRDGGRNDDDYLNELIGTLYLQKGNYIGAINWLSKVSPEYQYTLNTYKGGYLTRDPFAFTSESRLDTLESAKIFPKLRNKNNVKLNFANEMYLLEQQMRFGKNEKVRAVAKVKYALARYASFSSCWALTAYADGAPHVYTHDIYPNIRIEGHRSERLEIEKSRMERMIVNATKTINDDETAAEVQYLLGNLKTIAKKYPNTATAAFVSTHCDHWKDWI